MQIGSALPGLLAASASPASSAAPASSSCPLPDSFQRVDPNLVLNEQNSRQLQRALNTMRSATAQPYYDAAADAKAKDSYYAALKPQLGSLNPSQLYDALHTLVDSTHTTKLDYDPTQNLYPWVDLHPDLKLHSIYSGHPVDAAAAVKADLQSLQTAQQKLLAGGVTAGSAAQLGAAVAFSDANLPYNCEHVVPQSWFQKHDPMRGDLHHLFACEPGCNSARGNRMYFNNTDHSGQTLPNCGQASADGQHFEPGAGKGAVARATLYFLLAYPGQVGDQAGEYSPSDIKTLVEWSKAFPPDEYEFHRNEAIQEKQGNRNPLIDFPELVDRIDFTRGLGHH
jgi:endonuclease G, mitochondrial